MTKKARMTTQDVINAISDDSGDSDVDPDEPWNFGRNAPNQKFTPQNTSFHPSARLSPSSLPQYGIYIPINMYIYTQACIDRAQCMHT